MSRPFHPGMGQAVAERTVLRKNPDGSWETWDQVADRVAKGNSLLHPDEFTRNDEYANLYHHITNGHVLMSGRHLQHGDANQISRTQECFTNCSTAATSFLLFYLLMAGSGVGRCYDDDMMVVNWNNLPQIRCVLSSDHKDFDWSAHESVAEGQRKYSGSDTLWHTVGDSREGWAQVIELLEVAAFERIHRDKILVLDFSDVRPKGQPIKGMQGRPTSGPVPLMNSIQKIASLKGCGMPPWMQTMYVDHYLSECVLVGGARRSARIATKIWTDPDIRKFVTIKNGGYLWSANNSVAVDSAFWAQVNEEHSTAHQLFDLICSTNYGTGEPGFLNVDKLTANSNGLKEVYKNTDWIGSSRYVLQENTEIMMRRIVKRTFQKSYTQICNPCSEVSLYLLGGFCVLADVVPYHCETLEEAEDAFRAATRALIRVNTMESIYGAEVRRTNRIGVSITGIHEFAWKFFHIGFRDLINPDFSILETGVGVVEDPWFRAAAFWLTLQKFRLAVEDEARKYSEQLGVVMPHTLTCIKPAGSVSKLFGLTEGWHLPSMKQYLRWVQFSLTDPLVQEYKAHGYPTRKLNSYLNTMIVGFPTQPVISEIMPDDQLVCAAEATLEEQYRWLMLGEEFWLGKKYGNMISFTAKYDPSKLSLEELKETIRIYQPMIRCMSVMPQADTTAYEYQPEQAVTKAQFESMAFAIKRTSEDVAKEHIECAGGACPIDFQERT